MTIAIGFSYEIVFLAIAYFSACCYINGTSLFNPNKTIFAITKNKIIFLVLGFIGCAFPVVILNVVYGLKLFEYLKLLTLIMLLLPIASIDYKLQKIPNKFLLVGIGLRILFFVWEFILNGKGFFISLKDCIVGAVVIGLFFFLLLLIFKNSIGMGDVKLFALIGFYQGLWGGINSVFFSLLVSFFVSITLLITKKKHKKDMIPFGPCIYFGTIIAICLAGI